MNKNELLKQMMETKEQREERKRLEKEREEKELRHF